MLRDNSSEESKKKKNVNNDESHELINATGDDTNVTLASKEKSKMITKSRGSKSMVKTLKPEKKIKKRARKSKNTILDLLKSWRPKRKRNSVRIPAKRYKSPIVLGSSSLSEISQENISRSSSSSQLLMFPALPNHNQQPLDASTTVGLRRRRSGNVEKRLSASKRKVFHPRSPIRTVPNPPSPPTQEDVDLLKYFARNAEQRLDPLNQRCPLSSSNIPNSSSSSVQSQSNATTSSPQQQHQPSSSSMSLPQDNLPNSSSAAEFKPYGSRQQTPLLRRGFHLNLPATDDNED